ncbi:hypothetical protein [Thermus antranikianii]|uniref:hypothetical protein n=1 Tax=Thermus antranikianii TaxID=88190 RepID=UPI0012F9877D|nr:hypothetical protein [Thermus antranikianii]
MRKFLLVLMAFGLLAYAPLGARAQGHILALGVRGEVQTVEWATSLLESPSLLSDEELALYEGEGVIAGVIGGLSGAISAALAYTVDAAIGCNTGRCHANARDFAANVGKGFVYGFVFGLLTSPW